MQGRENRVASKKKVKTYMFTWIKLQSDYFLSSMITFCFLYRKKTKRLIFKKSCRWYWIQDSRRRPHHPYTQRPLQKAWSSRSDAGNKWQQNWSKGSNISQWLIVHLQVSQHTTRCANLIREITFADANKVFINRLPSLKDSAVTVFSFNWMHFPSAALRYLWRVSFGVKPHIAPSKLPRNI